MGVGMAVIVAPGDADAVIAAARGAGVPAWTLGETRVGTGRVALQ
jgi:phosphoribosylaminoimidazole (AIR) synthetase